VAVYRSEESDDVVDDPSLGWQAYLTGHAVLRKIPGGHADMLRIPNVRILCEDLRTELNAVSEVS
jgi:thioesterase domain-containing protein